MQVIELQYIYDSNLKHRLKQIDDSNVYQFEPAEEWMNQYIRIIYNTDESIFAFDADGMGHPLYVGDVLEGKTVANIELNNGIKVTLE